MREFFKGWRRKVGCGFLVVAFTLLMGAARSRLVADALWFPGEKRQHQVIAADGVLYWRGQDSEKPYWDVASADRPAAVVRLIDEQLASFGRDALDRRTKSHFTEWRIPYWYCVLPLTLLSACLIIWKPRKAR